MVETTKAHCNGCLGERKHEILHVYKAHWSDEETGINGYDQYELLKCLGCERITLRHISSSSEDYEPTIHYYPPSIFRSRPPWFNELLSLKDTRYIRNILQEIYVGLQNGTARLSTMGIRALLEFIMIQKVGDNGSFSKNLSEFERKGYISQGQRDILNTVLEAGHATMHRSYSPSQGDLVTCMDIAESVIETIYVHPLKAKKLTEKIPKRK